MPPINESQARPSPRGDSLPPMKQSITTDQGPSHYYNPALDMPNTSAAHAALSRQPPTENHTTSSTFSQGKIYFHYPGLESQSNSAGSTKPGRQFPPLETVMTPTPWLPHIGYDLGSHGIPQPAASPMTEDDCFADAETESGGIVSCSASSNVGEETASLPPPPKPILRPTKVLKKWIRKDEEFVLPRAVAHENFDTPGNEVSDFQMLDSESEDEDGEKIGIQSLDSLSTAGNERFAELSAVSTTSEQAEKVEKVEKETCVGKAQAELTYEEVKTISTDHEVIRMLRHQLRLEIEMTLSILVENGTVTEGLPGRLGPNTHDAADMLYEILALESKLSEKEMELESRAKQQTANIKLLRGWLMEKDREKAEMMDLLKTERDRFQEMRQTANDVTKTIEKEDKTSDRWIRRFIYLSAEDWRLRKELEFKEKSIGILNVLLGKPRDWDVMKACRITPPQKLDEARAAVIEAEKILRGATDTIRLHEYEASFEDPIPQEPTMPENSTSKPSKAIESPNLWTPSSETAIEEIVRRQSEAVSVQLRARVMSPRKKSNQTSQVESHMPSPHGADATFRCHQWLNDQFVTILPHTEREKKMHFEASEPRYNFQVGKWDFHGFGTRDAQLNSAEHAAHAALQVAAARKPAMLRDIQRGEQNSKAPAPQPVQTQAQAQDQIQTQTQTQNQAFTSQRGSNLTTFAQLAQRARLPRGDNDRVIKTLDRGRLQEKIALLQATVNSMSDYDFWKDQAKQLEEQLEKEVRWRHRLLNSKPVTKYSGRVKMDTMERQIETLAASVKIAREKARQAELVGDSREAACEQKIHECASTYEKMLTGRESAWKKRLTDCESACEKKLEEHKKMLKDEMAFRQVAITKHKQVYASLQEYYRKWQDAEGRVKERENDLQKERQNAEELLSVGPGIKTDWTDPAAILKWRAWLSKHEEKLFKEELDRIKEDTRNRAGQDEREQE